MSVEYAMKRVQQILVRAIEEIRAESREAGRKGGGGRVVHHRPDARGIERNRRAGVGVAAALANELAAVDDLREFVEVRELVLLVVGIDRGCAFALFHGLTDGRVCGVRVRGGSGFLW